MKLFFSALLITAVLSVAPASYAQIAVNQGPGRVTPHVGNLSGILYASTFGQWQVPAGNQGQFSWSSPLFCTVSTDAGVLNPVFAVGSPVTIIDTTPANTETVIPSAVRIFGSGCSITVATTHPHSSFYLASGTAGLQEAINFAHGQPYQVVISPDWTRLGGVTSMITSALGNTAVEIEDMRSACLVAYKWTGSAYAAQPSSCSGGGGGSSVSPPFQSVQLANQTLNGLTSDPNVLVNSTTHSLYVGGVLNCASINCFFLSPHGPLPAPWTLDTYSPATALGSIFSITTLGTSGPATLAGTSLNIPQYSSVTPAFSTVTAGTNTNPLVVGTGGSLAVSGSGTIAATTAAALAAGPSQCTGVQFATGIAASGNANCGTPSAVLASAGTNQAFVSSDTSGVSHSIPPQSRTYNVVVDGNLDNTGTTDISAALATLTTTLCAATNPPLIEFPSGTYKINSGWLISATSTTCSQLTIRGAGSGTILQTNCSGAGYGIWYNNVTNPGDNFSGLKITDLQIIGTGGASCIDGLRFTQTANTKFERLTITGFVGGTYSTGTISSSGATITGVGTTFTSAMVHGVVQATIGGVTYRAELCTFGSTTSLGLCSSSFPSGSLAGASYTINYGGRGLTCDPGNSFAQFGSMRDVYSYGNRFQIFAMGATSGGCSRFSVEGKSNYLANVNGSRTTDSIGIWLGKGSDTWDIAAPINNVAACVASDSAHAIIFRGECEDNATYAPVSTCNGGVATQSCIVMAEVSSDSNGHGWNFIFEHAYGYLVGTLYQFDNATGAFNSYISWDRTLAGQYLTHYNIAGTTGCPAPASGVKMGIDNYDCHYSIASIQPVILTIASFTAAANSCYTNSGTLVASTATFTATAMAGLTTKNAPHWSYTANSYAITGWGATGGMSTLLWPDAAGGQLDDVVCNTTGSPIVQPGITLNVGP